MQRSIVDSVNFLPTITGCPHPDPRNARPSQSSVWAISVPQSPGVLRAADRHDVIACARRPIDRLVLDRNGDSEELPLRTTTDPAQLEPADWILLCCKAHDTPATAPWLARLCTPASRVAVLQNGINHVERVAPYVGGATVVPTIVYYNGERLAPDHVRLRSVAKHDLVAPDEPAGRDFASVLEGTSLHVLLSDDFATLAWRKLLLNVIANPITALTLQRQSVLRRDDVHALCLEIMAEAIAVAKADGANLTDGDAAQTMATLFSYSGDLLHLDVFRPAAGTQAHGGAGGDHP